MGGNHQFKNKSCERRISFKHKGEGENQYFYGLTRLWAKR